MKSIKAILFTTLLILTLLKNGFSQNTNPTYELLADPISVPGDDKWDYSVIDSATDRLFISHGHRVQVIDLKTEKVVGEIENTPGVHGITIAGDINRGYISCGGNSTITVFELNTLKVITSVKITGKDPDAILYDKFSQRVFAFCGHSNNVVVIDTKNNSETGTIPLSGGPEFAVTNCKGKIYNNIQDKNEMAVINATTLKVEAVWPLAPCEGPTALAFDNTNNRLFTGCRGNKGLSVLDAITGRVIQTLPIDGRVDAVAYDASKKMIFSSNGDGSVTIIQQNDADHYHVIQTLKTQKGSKTMAFDPNTHKIYLCAAEFTEDKKVVPGTFKILVAGLKGY